MTIFFVYKFLNIEIVKFIEKWPLKKREKQNFFEFVNRYSITVNVVLKNLLFCFRNSISKCTHLVRERGMVKESSLYSSPQKVESFRIILNSFQ